MKDLKEALKKFELDSCVELQDEAVVRRVFEYCILLWEKNTKLNLTRHTDFDLFVARDLVDTLELSKLIETGSQVLDVGSGGGVPGMLLAIVRPDLEVTLTESIKKKFDALTEFAHHLGLQIEIHHQRAESLLEDFRYDVTIARAVGPLVKICRWFDGHWLSVGRLLALKGPRWIEERKEAREKGLMNNLDLRKVSEYPIPGTEWQSVILEILVKRD